MKVITHISQIEKGHRCGLTIGNYDGLHRGHKKFIRLNEKESNDDK